MCRVMSCSQVLYAIVVRSLQDSRVPVGTPEEIAVGMDPVLVDGEPRADVLKDTNDIPTGSSLESNDTEGEAGRGDPTSMRSWLSCRCIVGKFSSVCLL